MIGSSSITSTTCDPDGPIYVICCRWVSNLSEATCSYSGVSNRGTWPDALEVIVTATSNAMSPDIPDIRTLIFAERQAAFKRLVLFQRRILVQEKGLWGRKSLTKNSFRGRVPITAMSAGQRRRNRRQKIRGEIRRKERRQCGDG